MFHHAHWIWHPGTAPRKNLFLRFRKSFQASAGQSATLHLTASARYQAFLNGHALGQGPPRAWPQHYQFDSYDLSPFLRQGKNVLAVLAYHFGLGNMQWLFTPPGLLAELHLQSRGTIAFIGSDASWRTAVEPAFLSRVPRVCIQLGFEEQYDTRLAEPEWKEIDFDDSAWSHALALPEAPVQNLAPRDIPPLTARLVSPEKIIVLEVVQPPQQVWSLDLRPYFNPQDVSANIVTAYGFLFTQISSPEDTIATFIRLHAKQSRLKLNGVEIPGRMMEENYYFHFFRHELPLRKGWNSLLLDLREADHLLRFVMTIDAPCPLQLAWEGAAGGGPWVLLGPFEGPYVHAPELPNFPFYNVPTTTLQPEAALEKADNLWQIGKPDSSLLSSALAVEIRPEEIAADDVFARAFADQVLPGASVKIENPAALLTSTDGWTAISSPGLGQDVRLLLDFGREIVGHLMLEVEAPRGTIIDFAGGENRRPDGVLDWTEGTNNSMRYVCAGGRESYQSYWRRGLRFLACTVRGFSAPVLLHRIAISESIYPQQRRGAFTCSDDKLNRIWEVGAHTLACCSEDTYVDCPAYEQVHWVGDARNEALVDWVVNGDARLWRHCLLQAAYSLERSPLVESHVPSAWQNILPAWSFLWMRSCREYFLFTGDKKSAEELWPWLARQVEGIRKFINADRLFEIRAWNLFDWAAMDTLDEGVVTHQNCLLVMTLREMAELAEWLNKTHEAIAYRQLADELSRAIDQHLYDTQHQAYVDARHPDGRLSQTLSQQTQTMALISRVASGERASKARADMLAPPEGFVTAGSPFFMFFLLEVLMQEQDTIAVLEIIREKWGFMIDQGATTFWEMWSGKPARLTRSHCHGWSAAPTFFLSTYVLGVQPLAPGFSRTRIAPHPGDLRRAAGSVPTPHGEIHVEWQNPPEGKFLVQVKAPREIEIEMKAPTTNAEVTIEKL